MRPLAITFVHAPLLQHDQSDGALFGPLWAYTLSAHVPASWEASIVDCLRQEASTIGPAQVFAFSGTNQDIDSIRAVHAELKAKYPAATFILGGPITWSLQHEGKLELVDFFDRIFVLDGEETLPAFLLHFEAGTLAALPRVMRGDRFALAPFGSGSPAPARPSVDAQNAFAPGRVSLAKAHARSRHRGGLVAHQEILSAGSRSQPCICNFGSISGRAWGCAIRD
jgi:hypothetical protein